MENAMIAIAVCYIVHMILLMCDVEDNKDLMKVMGVYTIIYLGVATGFLSNYH